jgi:Major fimbrial subunit protein (FimA)
MKLRSYILLIVCVGLLLSCSEDNNIPETPVFKPDATLSFATSLDGVVATKATAGISEDADANIYSLQMLVFSGEGNEATFQKDTFITYSDPVQTPVINDMIVQSGRVSLLVLANHTKLSASFGDPISKVLDNKITLDQEGTKGFTMSSAINVYSLVPGKHNTIGKVGGGHTPANVASAGAVDLVRVVSKINLVKLTLSTEKLEDGSFPVKFEVDSIFVANVKSQSSIASLNASIERFSDFSWWFGAFAADSYNDIYSTVSGDLKDFLLLNVAKGDGGLTSGVTLTLSQPSYSASAAGQPIGKSFLVYENMNRMVGSALKNEVPLGEQTMLVVCGDYTRRFADGTEVTETDRFYTVPVNNYKYGVDPDHSFQDVDKHECIKRNVKYNIALTIKSSGSSTPYGKDAYAHIAARLEVLPWNVIKIDSDVD